MRLRFLLLCGHALSAGLGVAQIAKKPDFQSGVPAVALAQVSTLLPSGFSLDSIRLFNDFSKSRSSIAVLVSGRQGWEILAFTPAGSGKFQLEWKSGLLPKSFEVATPVLAVEPVDEKDAIKFTGCTAHMCPEIFSALIYVPGRKSSFIATCQDGNTHLSFPRSQASDDLMKHLLWTLHDEDIERKACGSDVRNLREGDRP